MASPHNLYILVQSFLFALALGNHHNQQNNNGPLECSSKWLEGYRLSSTQPHKTLLHLSVKECEEECLLNGGCAAFAYGALPPYNNTCELALSSSNPRMSRSSAQNVTMAQVDKSPPWDVYLIKRHGERCLRRSYLFGSGELNNDPRVGVGSRPPGGVPIDCFYRLVSGKRLAKPHSLRTMSVQTLQECQDGCIRENTFQCRSISYRFMPTTHTYSVSNCELSPFYIMTNQPQQHITHDFVDDFDYDYFQREPYCKTTSPGVYGVCAVVVRRSGRLVPTLARASHQVSTPSQCEHLCTTALFRCRAFAFRHTDRGRGSGDPFHRHGHETLSSCILYESEFNRLPSYNVENDPDYDLYEMGRLMGAECMLQGQYKDRYRPVTNPPFTSGIGGNNAVGFPTSGYPPPYPPGRRDPYRPLPPVQDREGYYPGGGGGSYPSSSYPSGGGYPPYDMTNNYRPGGTSSNRDRESPHDTLLPGDRTNYFKDPPMMQIPAQDERFPPPPGGGNKIMPAVPSTDSRFSPRPPQDRETGGPSSPSNIGSSSSSTAAEDQRRLHQQSLDADRRKEGMPIMPMQTQSSQGGCLVRLHTKPDSYLVPEVARATFPVKTMEECQAECVRSLDVLRFPCRVMSFRYTSHSGGTCQLSETPPHTLRDQDFMMSTSSSRENAMTFFYDEAVPGCERRGLGGVGGSSTGGSGYYDQNRRYDYYDYDRQRSRYGGGGSGGGSYYPGGGGSSSMYPGAGSGSGSYWSGSGGQGGYYGSRGGTGTGSGGYYNNYPSSNRYPSAGPFDRYPPSGGSGGGGYYNQHGFSSASSGSGGGGFGGSSREPFYPSRYDDPYVTRYTVDGERCLHSCVRNKEAGFHYCQTDHEGSWNFCCRPDDGQCGYSRGLSFAWCYVGTGPSRDIWRTCKRHQPITTIQYIHEKNPPVVHKLNGSEPIGNLTLSDAVDLLEDKSEPSPQKAKESDKLIKKPTEPINSGSSKNDTVTG